MEKLKRNSCNATTFSDESQKNNENWAIIEQSQEQQDVAIQKNADDITSLKSQQNTLDSKTTNLEQQVGNLNSDNEGSKSTLQQLSQKSTDLTAEVKNLKNRDTELASQISGLGNSLNPLSNKIDNLELADSNLQQSVTDLGNSSQETASKLQEITHKQNQNSLKIQELQDNFSSVNRDLNSTSNTVTEHSNQINDLQLSKSYLETDLESINTEIADIKQNAQAAKTKADTLHTQTVTLQDSVYIINHNIDALEQQDAAFTARLVEITNANTETDERLNTYGNLISTLTTKVNQSKAQAETTASELDSYKTTTNGTLQTYSQDIATLQSSIGDKVDKVAGKGLSTNDFTNALKSKLEGLSNFNPAGLQTAIDGKVDKVSGKGLSTNDFTNALKAKLTGLQNYDDTEIRSTLDQRVVKVNGKGLSTNDFTNALKSKLENLHNFNPASLQSAIATKVDKVSGKGLSTNDFTNPLKSKLESLTNYDDSALQSEVNKKVDKVSGKGLSTNDFTNAQKNKLAGLSNFNPAGLQAQITAKVDKVSGKGLSTNDFTNALKTKLEGLNNFNPSGLQSAINQANSTAQDAKSRAETADSKVNELQNTVNTIHTKTNQNTAKLGAKVDKVTGKGLSTNDFTNAQKNDIATLKSQVASGQNTISSLQTQVGKKLDKTATATNSNKLEGKSARDFQISSRSPAVLYSVGGGSYTTTSKNAPKYLKIRLPNNSFRSVMVSFTVSIFFYQRFKSIQLRLSGYVYQASKKWIHTTANTISGEVSTDVQFGREGDYPVVWINLTDGYIWQYPQVTITDFSAGFNGTYKHADYWRNGWNISFTDTAPSSSNIHLTHPVLGIADVPVGHVLLFAGVATPRGYLRCNGAAISRTKYKNLFTAIGTRYGAGNGSSTFNIPDCRGLFPRFADNGRGFDPGRTAGGPMQQDAVGRHWPHEWLTSTQQNSVPVVQATTQANKLWLKWVRNGWPGIGNETRPKNLSFNGCIRY